MKAVIRVATAAIGIAAALSIAPATAADMDAYGQYSLGHLKATSQPMGPYGSPAGNMASDREIRLDSATRSVSVGRHETVKFVIPGTGREFRWRFDTSREIDAFPLARIAPTDVQVNPNVTVVVQGARGGS